MADHWSPRANTKRGGIHPPRTSRNRHGEAGSAMRRHEDRYWDKRTLAGYVQLAPGVLVAWERKPWRVLEVAERPIDLWSAKYENGLADALALTGPNRLAWCLKTSRWAGPRLVECFPSTHRLTCTRHVVDHECPPGTPARRRPEGALW